MMKIFFLEGDFSIENWTDLQKIMKKLPHNTHIDVSHAKLDNGCKLIIDKFNEYGNFDLKLERKNKEIGFFSFLKKFFVDFIKYLVSVLKFFSIFSKQPKEKFQRELIIQDIMNSCYTMGIQAIPIVAFFSFCMGVIIAVECVEQLRVFGAEMTTVNFIALAFFKELALFTGLIVLAARSAGSIIARIGVMRISDEWNAIKILGLDPEVFLLYPKIIAFIVLTPFLSYIASFCAIMGGYVSLKNTLNLNMKLFVELISYSIDFNVFIIILLKGPVFGLVAGMIICYEAKKISLHTENMVFHITRGVVYSIVGTIFVDMLMNIGKMLYKL